MVLKNILANGAAFDALANGGHPAEFLASNQLTFEDHFKLIEDAPEYMVAFYRAVTASLAVWHTVADQVILGRIPKASSYHRTAALTGVKFDTKLWQARLKDIERYLPAMRMLETVLTDDQRIGEITIHIDAPVDTRKNDKN